MRLRHALIAAAVAIATVAGATPASAYTYTFVYDLAGNDAGDVAIVGFGTGRTIRSDSTMDIEVDCSALTVSRVLVTETGVDCYLRNGFSSPPVAYYSEGFGGGPVWTRGASSTFHLVFTNLPVANYVVCIGFGYTTSPGAYPSQWLNQGGGHSCNNASG